MMAKCHFVPRALLMISRGIMAWANRMTGRVSAHAIQGGALSGSCPPAPPFTVGFRSAPTHGYPKAALRAVITRITRSVG
jgi:hypothetical protein